MDLDILFGEDQEEYDIRSVYRGLRASFDPFRLGDTMFIEKYRLSKTAFRYVLNEIRPLIQSKIHCTITPVHKLCIALTVLAKGSYQSSVGTDFVNPMKQNTVSKVLWEVLPAMERVLCQEWIKFTKNELCKEHFYQKYRIPGVVGSIDGAHLPILKPGTDEHMFLNRKSYHSLNAMVVCDHNLRIMAFNARYGGAAHDSFVYKESPLRTLLYQEFINGDIRSWLLGDSGYPLEPWLLTPYRNAAPGTPEARFNEWHSRARSSVERCIGVLKARWRILLIEKKGRYSPTKSVQISNVCAALHNICKFYNVPDPAPIVDRQRRIPIAVQQNESALKTRAERIRDSIKQSLP
uniref:Putative harbinger-4 pst n=1 Tax=Nyssomyia neivai TaxID=330878 RepID=A0A1L8DIS7_9DIPT